MIIETQRDGAWLTIWFNRPETRNALSTELMNELFPVMEETAATNAIHGVTVRGRGGVFCAGGDLKMFKRVFQGGVVGDEGQAAAESMSQRGGQLFAAMADLPQPLIAVVEGAAMAGGMGLACGADFVLTTRDAKFALTETRLGITPAQITPYVVERTGATRARQIMLTGSVFDGEEALRLGVADYVGETIEDVEQREQELRREILRCAPGANAVTKALVAAAPGMERDAFIQLASTRFAESLMGEEGREGVASFMEKRRPDWSGGGASDEV